MNSRISGLSKQIQSIINFVRQQARALQYTNAICMRIVSFGLGYMLKNKNIALTREKLICEVWGYDYFGDDRTLDTHIKLLRKSLGKYAGFIVTLRGVGYRFDVESMA